MIGNYRSKGKERERDRFILYEAVLTILSNPFDESTCDMKWRRSQREREESKKSIQ